MIHLVGKRTDKSIKKSERFSIQLDGQALKEFYRKHVVTITICSPFWNGRQMTNEILQNIDAQTIEKK